MQQYCTVRYLDCRRGWRRYVQGQRPRQRTSRPLARRVVRTLRSSPSLALFVLAGCAPDLGEAPRVQPPTAYADAKSFAAPAADWPSDAWWKAYGDPQLDQLIDEALADSPDLKAAAARVRGATAMAEVAGANLWPTVVGAASVTKTEQSPTRAFPPLPVRPSTRLAHAGQIAASLRLRARLLRQESRDAGGGDLGGGGRRGGAGRSAAADFRRGGGDLRQPGPALRRPKGGARRRARPPRERRSGREPVEVQS